MSQPTTSAQDAGQPLTSYPPKPEGATHFQRDYGYQPATVIRWEWSTTFDRWCALVKFEDGSECFTWPKPYPHIPMVPAGWDTAGALAEDEQPAQPASAPQATTYSDLVASLSLLVDIIDKSDAVAAVDKCQSKALRGTFSDQAGRLAVYTTDARALLARATLSTVG